MWYIAAYFGILPSILLSALAFGIAHSCRGATNAAQTAIIGLWMAVLYWLTGSLWLSMVAHFLVDVISGKMIPAVLSEGEPPAGDPESGPEA